MTSIMQFVYRARYILYKLTLFIHKDYFITNTLFVTFHALRGWRAAICWGRGVGTLHACCVSVGRRPGKQAHSKCLLQGAPKGWESEGVKSVLLAGWMWTAHAMLCNCFPRVQIGVGSNVSQEENLTDLAVWLNPSNSPMSARIAPNWLWHRSLRTPLQIFLYCHWTGRSRRTSTVSSSPVFKWWTQRLSQHP